MAQCVKWIGLVIGIVLAGGCGVTRQTERTDTICLESVSMDQIFSAAEQTLTGMQFAIEKAGSLDQNKIRDALRGMDIETFFGKFKFDEAGRNVAGRMGIVQVQNGKQVLIDPPRPGVKLLYPAPPWKERP